jgi:predicted small secreted protein
MKRVALLVLAMAVLAVAGCNTMQGFGKDVEKAGEAIQKSTK